MKTNLNNNLQEKGTILLRLIKYLLIEFISQRRKMSKKNFQRNKIVSNIVKLKAPFVSFFIYISCTVYLT